MPRKALDPAVGIIRSFMRLPLAEAAYVLKHLAIVQEERLLAESATTTAASVKKARKPKAKGPAQPTVTPVAPATFAPENTAAQPVGPRRRVVGTPRPASPSRPVDPAAEPGV